MEGAGYAQSQAMGSLLEHTQAQGPVARRAGYAQTQAMKQLTVPCEVAGVVGVGHQLLFHLHICSSVGGRHAGFGA